MNKDTFWEIIATAKEKAGSDTDKRQEIITSLLQQYSPEDIELFGSMAGAYAYAASDNLAVWGACKAIEGYASDDTFLYFCFWLVSQGREIYTQAVKNPDTLATQETMNCKNTGDGCIFEMLMYCSFEAYQLKTGKEPEIDMSQPSEEESAKFQAELFEGIEFADDSILQENEIEAKRRLPEVLPKLTAMFHYDAEAEVAEMEEIMNASKDPEAAKALLAKMKQQLIDMGLDESDLDF